MVAVETSKRCPIEGGTIEVEKVAGRWIETCIICGMEARLDHPPDETPDPVRAVVAGREGNVVQLHANPTPLSSIVDSDWKSVAKDRLDALLDEAHHLNAVCDEAVEITKALNAVGYPGVVELPWYIADRPTPPPPPEPEPVVNAVAVNRVVAVTRVRVPKAAARPKRRSTK